MTSQQPNRPVTQFDMGNLRRQALRGKDAGKLTGVPVMDPKREH